VAFKLSGWTLGSSGTRDLEKFRAGVGGEAIRPARPLAPPATRDLEKFRARVGGEAIRPARPLAPPATRDLEKFQSLTSTASLSARSGPVHDDRTLPTSGPEGRLRLTRPGPHRARGPRGRAQPGPAAPPSPRLCARPNFCRRKGTPGTQILFPGPTGLQPQGFPQAYLMPYIVPYIYYTKPKIFRARRARGAGWRRTGFWSSMIALARHLGHQDLIKQALKQHEEKHSTSPQQTPV